MAPELILQPLLAQVFLTLLLFIWLSLVKSKALKKGEVDLERRALHHEAWPDYVLKVSNNIRNQFETPVLFYVLVILLFLLKAVDMIALILAWAYFASRIAHVIVHTGINIVPIRKSIFSLGFLILSAMLGLIVQALYFS